MRRLALCLLVLALGACQRDEAVEQREEGRFGTARIYRPAAGERGAVFLFSDTAGWNAALERTARALAADGIAVVGVDLPQYLRGLAASDDGCHYLLSEIEDLSERVQRGFGFAGYRTPILAGIGAGGTLTYAALSQTPAATVAGAISIDPAAALGTTVPLCPGAPSRAVPGGFSYERAPDLPGWWEVSPLGAVPEPLRSLATPAAADGAAADRLLALLRAALPANPAAAGSALSDLPLVPLPATTPGAVMAVIYSGDGGWRDIDKEIGEALAARGVPVVGVDCLRYFWRAKTPDDVARDLAHIIDHYTAIWHTPRVALIGYSFGAGVLPFAYNRLPEQARAQVAQLSLLGVEHHALFEFKLAEWFSSATDDDGPPVMPELQRIPLRLVQCFYGEEEDDTVCGEKALSAAQIIRTEGGHHFDGDYGALADRILAGPAWQAVPTPSPPP